MSPSRHVVERSLVVLTLAWLLGCSGGYDTQVRTFPSGRQVEVFRVFAQESPRGGTMLNYFYFSQYLDDQPKFEAELSDVLADAQGEAERVKAREVYLSASVKQHWLVDLISGGPRYSATYESDGHGWRKVRSHRSPSRRT